jgi:radical SAM superfamily enzyme YgiQ (UPF0313 family)|tara:strand:+ start:1671 stop:3191 length:1521 start_codon:yes stop_codon:yes gene_type:complete
MVKEKYYKRPGDLRILLVYPNIQQALMVRYSIGLFTALLKREGFQVGLFDTSFYRERINKNQEYAQIALKKVDWAESSIRFKTTNMLDDWVNKVEEFDPDIIALSVAEGTYSVGRVMIRALPDKYRKIPILWGGVFATFGAEVIFRDNVGNFVCRGEGEHSLVEFCHRVCKGKSLYNIPGIWARKDGKIIRNSLDPVPVDLDTLPFPDYSLFEEQAFYRPMQGEIRRVFPIETQRGCPFKCTFCNSPAKASLYKNESDLRFYRKKSIRAVRDEIEHIQKKYGVDFIYMLTDTFLAMSDKEFDELVEMYSDFRIPFWMNTSPQTMTRYRAKGLEEMNLLRMNMGFQHGNTEFRKKILKRRSSEQSIVEGFESCVGSNFTVAADCMLGFPGEDRRLAFDTIELFRKLPKIVEPTGGFIFAPFHGTELRQKAAEMGCYDKDLFCDFADQNSCMINQPQFPQKEVLGLVKTYILYQTIPKSKWKWIEKAENNTEEGEHIFEQLVTELCEK